MAACWACVGPLFLSALPFKLLNDASQFVGPIVLNLLLASIAPPTSGPSSAATVGAEGGALGGHPLQANLLAGGSSNSTTMDHLWSTPSHHGQTLTGQTWQALGVLFSPEGAYKGYAYALLLFAGTVVGVLGDNQHFIRVQRAGFRLKSIMTAEVYRKVSQG
jgi:hypothetical protein